MTPEQEKQLWEDAEYGLEPDQVRELLHTVGDLRKERDIARRDHVWQETRAERAETERDQLAESILEQRDEHHRRDAARISHVRRAEAELEKLQKGLALMANTQLGAANREIVEPLLIADNHYLRGEVERAKKHADLWIKQHEREHSAFLEQLTEIERLKDLLAQGAAGTSRFVAELGAEIARLREELEELRATEVRREKARDGAYKGMCELEKEVRRLRERDDPDGELANLEEEIAWCREQRQIDRKGREKFLLHLVDVVWGDAMEDGQVPSTRHAVKLIEKAEATLDHHDTP